MSRAVVALAAGVLAASFTIPAFGAELVTNNFGIPVAPQGGNASIHQWGGVDDSFAVNPDGDEAPPPGKHKVSPLAQNQDDSDDNDPGDPDPDHFDEILPI
ncbi:MAG TPA: hypothetical protein VHU18_08880 [Rhizomicrobium sp.]|jgi:hypothetical protein|nr:hypothetical protein [Rhizomicrobium sp.]